MKNGIPAPAASFSGFLRQATTPLSFSYDGTPFTFYHPVEATTLADDADCVRTRLGFLSDDMKLLLHVTATRHRNFPAVEFLAELSCRGAEQTEVVEAFQPLDLAIAPPGAENAPIRVRLLRDSPESGLTPVDLLFGGGGGRPRHHALTCADGERASCDWLPWVGVDFDGTHGFEAAIGYSSAWRASFDWADASFRLRLGVGCAPFCLQPGERIRMPPILLFRRDGATPRGFQAEILRFMDTEQAPRDFSALARRAAQQPRETSPRQDMDKAAALRANLKWFENSGVMDPPSGIWGVAERIAVASGNAALEQMQAAFPAWTDRGGHVVIEQRRPDCNFSTAYLYLLASRALGEKGFATTAENLLDYLYFRSGLLNRADERFPLGSWNWSNIKRESVVYFDDEAWCLFLQLEIADRFPALAARYDIPRWAAALARSLADGAARVFAEKARDDDGHLRDQSGAWLGRLDLPHWGALVCMALARACRDVPDATALAFIRAYYDYLDAQAEAFNASEQAYAAFATCAVWRYLGEERYRAAAVRFGRLLAAKADANGNLPAEHREASAGQRLVDMVHTANWALLAYQSLTAVDASFQAAYDRLLALVLSIQDSSPDRAFNGCWRGTFDLDASAWGGGDRSGGGAGSACSGWTNAPVSTVLALDILGATLFTLP